MRKLFVIFTLFVLAISLLSCSDEKYTVWTETQTYADFFTATQVSLEDGYYIRYEITRDQWPEVSKSLTSEGRHRWSEEEIKKWLIGNGFGETESRKESSWLAMTDHGFIVIRDRTLVYMILK